MLTAITRAAWEAYAYPMESLILTAITRAAWEAVAVKTWGILPMRRNHVEAKKSLLIDELL